MAFNIKKGIKNFINTDSEDIDSVLNDESDNMETKVTAEIKTLEPRTYEEARKVATFLIKKIPVIVNFKRTDSKTTKRIIDFLAGVLFALGGTMKNLGAQGVYIFSPQNVSVVGDITPDGEYNSIKNDDDDYL